MRPVVWLTLLCLAVVVVVVVVLIHAVVQHAPLPCYPGLCIALLTNVLILCCRRGYRSESAVHKAALNEAAAAGLLLLAGWQDTCQQEGEQTPRLCNACVWCQRLTEIAPHTNNATTHQQYGTAVPGLCCAVQAFLQSALHPNLELGSSRHCWIITTCA
jgi:hypothetical protein